MPPHFGSRSYWRERLPREAESGCDWLMQPEQLDEIVQDALSRCRPRVEASGNGATAHCGSEPRPRILHVGCGSSKWSIRLKEAVHDPRQIVNVDYAEEAIELGQKWEVEHERQSIANQSDDLEANNSDGTTLSKPLQRLSMQWKVIDLLDAASVRTLTADSTGTFDLILDKSTCDAIACGDDVEITLPHPWLSEDRDSSSHERSDTPKSLRIHPIDVLAINLAAVTRSDTRWVAISYSKDRFAFLGRETVKRVPYVLDSNPDDLQINLPRPSRLWEVEKILEFDVEDLSPGGEAVVHRPKIANHVYILRRTTTKLGFRDSV